MFSDNLTWDRHVESVSNKATSMLSWFAKAFETRDVAVWRRLYTTYIRPHVEYAVQAWRPFRQKDIETLERVQRKATKVPAESPEKRRVRQLGSWLSKENLRGFSRFAQHSCVGCSP